MQAYVKLAIVQACFQRSKTALKEQGSLEATKKFYTETGLVQKIKTNDN
jgi:hypothetical protein